MALHITVFNQHVEIAYTPNNVLLINVNWQCIILWIEHICKHNLIIIKRHMKETKASLEQAAIYAIPERFQNDFQRAAGN